MADEPNPRTTSSDYDAMHPYWHKVSAVLGGADTLRATAYASVAGPHLPVPNLSQLDRRSGGAVSPYLPKYANESSNDYEVRRFNAPLTNIYADISANLSSKPFSKLCELDTGSSADLKKLQSDIDGRGNNLHVFARTAFKDGLDKAIDWILVDFTKVPQGVTLADERAMNARPYWVHVSAESMLAVYSKFVGGREVIHHARIYEPSTEQRGYGEETVERVRIFDREVFYDDLGAVTGFGGATFEVWEEKEVQSTTSAAAITAGATATATQKSWVKVDFGAVSIGIIPLVPYVCGRRDGTSWRVTPALRDIVNLQIEEFQQESNLKSVKELTAFPMLTGNGITQSKDKDGNPIQVPVGPRGVLFAPMSESGTHGSWQYIEPAATSLTFLASDLEKLRTEMRDLGMQPLTSANLTVITTANIAMKAHNAVQAWALGLKDALEQAMRVTCMWLGRPAEMPIVKVHVDFAVDLEDKDSEQLLKGESQGIFSKQTIREEFKRRKKLSDDYDPEEEEERLALQNAGLEPEEEIDPRTGLPVEPKQDPALTVQ